MKVLMIAPPGAGKGTQGAVIAAHFDIPHIATGDLLRDHVARRTALGRQVQEYLDRGELVLYQIGLELEMTADVALHLEADDAELTRRLLARAALEHRSDDTADVIAQRLALYHEVTSPILAWYGQRGVLVSIGAMRPAEQVGR